MKLFISWSGETSKGIASEFREWLPLINKDVKPYMSSQDIEKGAHWPSQLRNELALTMFGIVILTPENRHSEWLHFEAGAVVKSVEDGRLVPILFGLKQSEVGLPLSLYQTANFEMSEMLQLVRSINASAADDATDDKALQTMFEAFGRDLKARSCRSWPVSAIELRRLKSRRQTLREF